MDKKDFCMSEKDFWMDEKFPGRIKRHILETEDGSWIDDKIL
jgi:hypothetical protein